MYSIFKLPAIDLKLFDGAAAAASGDAGGAAAPGDAASTGSEAGKPGKQSGGKVLYGKQAPQESGGSAPEDGAAADTPEAKREAWTRLVSGEYREQYEADTRQLTQQHAQELQGLQNQIGSVQPIVEMLMGRYGIADGDLQKLTTAMEADDQYWTDAADEAGMSVEQYKQFQKLQRDNRRLLAMERQRSTEAQAQAQIQKWNDEAAELKALYPSFDLASEVKNKEFLSLLRAHVPVKHAYEVVHMEDIKNGIAQTQAKATEKQIVDGIRARGNRPTENGAASTSGFIVKDDVSKLTKEDRANIAKRAARGEIIRF